MTIAIAGKNNIAVNALEFLIKKYPEHKIVVTCNPNENGENDWQKSLRYFAKLHGIEEVSLTSLYEIEDLLFLSLEYANIVKPELFKSKRLYNIHFSLLPKYKGMFTSVMPILNNEAYSGVTLHKMERGIDTGDIIAQKKFELGVDDSSLELYHKYLKNAFQLFVENIDTLIENDEITWARQQDATESTYYSKSQLDFKNIVIDLKQTAMNIHNQIRAFNFRPYQLAKVFDVPVVNSVITNVKSTVPAGRLLYETDEYFMLSTIDYNLVIIKDRLGMLLEACKENDIECVQKCTYLPYFVNEKNEYGWTPLTVAVYNGNMEIAKHLLAAGADPYVINNNGTTLLMYAKNCYLNTGNSEMFEIIYSLGVDAKQKDFYAKSLYEYCVEQNFTEIGKYKVADFK